MTVPGVSDCSGATVASQDGLDVGLINLRRWSGLKTLFFNWFINVLFV